MVREIDCQSKMIINPACEIYPQILDTVKILQALRRLYMIYGQKTALRRNEPTDV